MSFVENEVSFHFDVKSLYKQHLASQKYQNPLTRQALSDAVIANIQAYRLKRHINVYITNRGVDVSLPRYLSLCVDRSIYIGHLILDIIRAVHDTRSNRHPLDCPPTLTLRVNGLKHDLYDLDPMAKLSSINNYQKVLIESFPIIWSTSIGIKRQRDRILPKLFEFAKKQHNDALLELIPDKYKQKEPVHDEPSELDAEVILNFLQNNNAMLYNRKFFRIAMYFSIDRRISREQADEICAKVDLPNEYQHLVYSHVVDKWNMRSHGVQTYYAQSRYDPPDYQFRFPNEPMTDERWYDL